MQDIIKDLKGGIQWYDGLLVYPQHYQQQDRELKQFAVALAGAVCPFFWGVIDFEVDEAALTKGIFRPKALLAIMPDGSIIHADQDSLPEIDLNELREDSLEKELPVHLCVVKHREEGGNLSGEFPRQFATRGNLVTDDNTAENEIRMQRVHVKPYLVAGDHVPVRYISFPLAGVRFQDEGFVVTDFIPACVSLTSEPRLLKEIQDIVVSLREKITFLAERLQSAQTQENAPILKHFSFEFSCIVPLVTSLESILNAHAQPYQVYLELCRIAGPLSSLVPGQIPPLLDPYKHGNLRGSFAPLIKLIRKLLDVVQDTCTSIWFKIRGRSFVLDMEEDWVGEKSIVIGLRVPPKLFNQDVVKWLSAAVIVSGSKVNEVRDKRVLGADRTVAEVVPEMGLMSTPDMVLVRVKVNPSYIVAGEELQIFNNSEDPEVRPAGVVLYVPD